MTFVAINAQILFHLPYHIAGQVHGPKFWLRISKVEDDSTCELVVALSCVLFNRFEYMYAIPASGGLAARTHALLQQNTASKALCIEIPEVDGGDTAFVVSIL